MGQNTPIIDSTRAATKGATLCDHATTTRPFWRHVYIRKDPRTHDGGEHTVFFLHERGYTEKTPSPPSYVLCARMLRCRHAGLSPRPQRALPRPQPLPGHARTSTRNVSQGIQDSPRSDADRIAHPWRILTMIRSPQPNRGAAATRQQRRSSPAIFLPDLAGEPSPSSWTRRRCVPSVRWSLCAGHAREDPLRP